MSRLAIALIALAALIAIAGSSCQNHHPRGGGDDMPHRQEMPRNPTGGGGGY